MVTGGGKLPGSTPTRSATLRPVAAKSRNLKDSHLGTVRQPRANVAAGGGIGSLRLAQGSAGGAHRAQSRRIKQGINPLALFHYWESGFAAVKRLALGANLFEIFTQFLDSPFVMAGCSRNTVGAERGRTRPREICLGEQFFVAEVVDEFHYSCVAVDEVLADGLKFGALMLCPDFLVESWRGSPRVRGRKKGLWLAVAVVVDEREQHTVPLMQVGEHVAQVFVTRPMCFFTDLGDAGIKICMSLSETHARDQVF